MVSKSFLYTVLILVVGVLLLLNFKLFSCPTIVEMKNTSQHALLRLQSLLGVKKEAYHIPDVSGRNRSHNSSQKKHFLYVTQTESCLSRHFRRPDQLGVEAESFDILVLSWSEQCTSSEAQFPHVEYIFTETNTTWSQGRTLLFWHIMKHRYNYLYYIFMDDDNLMFFTDTFQFYHNEYAELMDFLMENVVSKYLGFREIRSKRGNNAYREFEKFLLDFEPAVGLPNICFHDRHDCVTNWIPDIWAKVCDPKQPLPVPIISYSNFDAAFNAFHRDALPYLLPYESGLDNISWHESQKYINLASDLKFQGQVLTHLLITSWGPAHRPYPRGVTWSANWERILRDLRSTVPREYHNKTDVLPFSVSKRRRDMIRVPLPVHSPIVPYAHYKLRRRSRDCRNGAGIYDTFNEGFNYRQEY